MEIYATISQEAGRHKLEYGYNDQGRLKVKVVRSKSLISIFNAICSMVTRRGISMDKLKGSSGALDGSTTWSVQRTGPDTANFTFPENNVYPNLAIYNIMRSLARINRNSAGNEFIDVMKNGKASLNFGN